MALRDVHSSLKAALILNDEFTFSHLIKFEKPKNTKDETFGPLDYAYITDGPYPIEYEGNTYLPKNVYKIGAIKEHTVAKATNMSLVLGADALGTELEDTITVSSSLATDLYDHYNFNSIALEGRPGNEAVRSFSKTGRGPMAFAGQTIDAVTTPNADAIFTEGPVTVGAYPPGSFYAGDQRYGELLDREESISFKSKCSFTISLWIYDSVPTSVNDSPNAFGEIVDGGSEGGGYIISGYNRNTSIDFLSQFAFKLDQTATLQNGNRTLTMYPGNKTTTITPGQWNHLAISYDGTTARFYINGTFTDSHNYAWTQIDLNGQVAGSVMSLGASTKSNQHNYDNEFKGRISEVRLYQRALSATELADLYDDPTGQSIANRLLIRGAVDKLRGGFQLGDTVTFTGSSSSQNNHNKRVRIDQFKNDGKDIIVSSIGEGFIYDTSATYTLRNDNSELGALLISKADNDYSSYIHRQVEIQRVYLKPKTGAIIGDPLLLFRGHINTGSIQQDVGKTTKVTWALTSHWGDFVRVNGRLTSDRHHRAVGSNGEPDQNALVNPFYAEDYGFEYADRAVNMIANYMTYEKRYKMKRRGGLAGALGLKRQIEYDVEVIKDVDLRFNLSAKFLPVVYGVQKVDSFPVFADSEIEDPDTDILEAGNLYVALAICEGEIGGVYDIHIDDVPTLCTDAVDYGVRGRENENRADSASVLCQGRADRGDVLSGSNSNLNAFAYVDGFYFENLYDPGAHTEAETQIRNAVINDDKIPTVINVPSSFDIVTTSDVGIRHSEFVTFSSPIESQITFHAGKFDQLADAMLTQISRKSKFTVQRDYYGGHADYWSGKHKLLDTAYVSGRFVVKEGETTIPKYTFVVKGSYINCYNYDNTFTPAAGFEEFAGSTGSYTNFIPGTQVKFYDADGIQIPAGDDSATQYDAVTVLHRFDVIAKDRRSDTPDKEIRFVWDKPPKPTKPSFYMLAIGTSNKYWFVNHNFVLGETIGSEVRLADNWSTDLSLDISSFTKSVYTSGNGWFSPGSTTPGFFTLTGAPSNTSDLVTIAENVLPDEYKYQIQDQYNVVTGEDVPDRDQDYYAKRSEFQSFLSSTISYDTDRIINVSVYNNTDDEVVIQQPINYDVSNTTYLLMGVQQSYSVAMYSKSSYRVQYVNAMFLGNTDEFRDKINSQDKDYKLWINNFAKLSSDVADNQVLELDYGDGDTPQVLRVKHAYANGWVNFATPLRKPLKGHERFIHSKGLGGNTRPGADLRVSINPAMQLLDYLTNRRYGKGLDIDKDIDLESFKAAARKCDERSDVTLINHKYVGQLQEGATYALYLNDDTTSRLLWQGTIKEIKTNNVRVGNYNTQSNWVQNLNSSHFTVETTTEEVVFTNCIGKLIHKWNDWKVWTLGDILYHDGKIYNPVVNAAIPDFASLSAYGAAGFADEYFNLIKTSGSGPGIFKPHVSSPGSNHRTIAETNPLVKSLGKTGRYDASGYSLYDSDNVKYWKLCGWDEHSQYQVTRHQTNCVIDTSKPIFQNVNLMLQQFNGILRYTNGKYSLDIKTKAPDTFDQADIDGTLYTPADFDKGEIIGKLKIVDKQQKDTFNAISTQIVDPQNKFNTTDVNFFNSDYLLQDRNINKAGNLEQPHITNYYNARINVEQHLDNSRAGLKVSFRTLPRAILLLPGDFIRLTHNEYGFNKKVFRISDLSLEADGLVTIDAEEYFDKAYKLSSPDTQIQKLEGGEKSSQQLMAVKAPSSISITNSTVQAVKLSWVNSDRYSSETHSIEILRSSSNSLSSASSIATTRGFEYIDYFDNTISPVTNYYWIRYVVVPKNTSSEADQPGVRRSPYLFDTSVSASSGFVGIARPLNAGNVSYSSGNTIEILEPSEGGADSTSNALNNNVAGASSPTVEVTSQNGGLIFRDGGAIRSNGKTAASSSTAGFFMGYDNSSSAYTFGVGDSVKSIEWDGTDLTVTGKIVADSGDIGGWGISGSSIYAGAVNPATFDPSGYIEGLASNSSAMVLHTQGSIHAKNFFINSDGSAGFRGSVSAATGTFHGSLLENSITDAELETGGITANALTTGTITGREFARDGIIAVYDTDSLTGSIIESSFVALDGNNANHRIYAGASTASEAPFRVSKEGRVFSQDMVLSAGGGNTYFDSATGFSLAAISQLGAALSTRVYSFSELWSDEADFSGTPAANTVEKITLTETSTLNVGLQVPTAGLTASASEEYFGLVGNSIFANIDFSQISGNTTLTSANFTKPDGTALNRPLKVGEIVRVQVSNFNSPLVFNQTNGFVNAITGTSFGSTTISRQSFTIFYLKATGLTAASGVITHTGPNHQVTISLGTNTATPDTTTTARNKLPTAIDLSLLRREGLNGSDTTVFTDTFSSTFAAVGGANLFRVVTVKDQVLGSDKITSEVEVAINSNAVNNLGFITKSTADGPLSPGEYYYHSSMSSVSGTDTSKDPSTRVFEVTLTDTTKPGFLLEGNAASQSTVAASITDLAMGGNMSVEDGFQIIPGSGGTVTIQGNLEVTGNTITATQQSLQVTDKDILLSANSANASQVQDAGLIVDRSEFDSRNPTLLWNESGSTWSAAYEMTSSSFRIADSSSGSFDKAHYGFADRPAAAGMFATDATGFGGDGGTSIYLQAASQFGFGGPRLRLDNRGLDLSGGNFVLNTNSYIQQRDTNTVFQPWNSTYDTEFRFGTTSGATPDGDDPNAGGLVAIFKSATRRVGIHTYLPRSVLDISVNNSVNNPGLTSPHDAFDTTQNTHESIILESMSSDTGVILSSPSNKTQQLIFAQQFSNSGTLAYGNRIKSAGNSLQFWSNYRKVLDFNALETELVPIGGSSNNTISDTFDRGLTLRTVGSAASNKGMALSFVTSRSTANLLSNYDVVRSAIRGGTNTTNSNYAYGYLGFYTNEFEDESSTSLKQQMRIDHEGRVCINVPTSSFTNRAQNLLEIQADGMLNKSIILSHDQGGVSQTQTSGIYFQGRERGEMSSAGTYTSGVAGYRQDSDDGTGISFLTCNAPSQANSVKRMLLTKEGRLAVGETAANSIPDIDFKVESTGLHSLTKPAASSETVAFELFSMATWKSSKLIIQVEDPEHGFSETTELLVVTDANTSDSAHRASATEYGFVTTNPDHSRMASHHVLTIGEPAVQCVLQTTPVGSASGRTVTVVQQLIAKAT